MSNPTATNVYPSAIDWRAAAVSRAKIPAGMPRVEQAYLTRAMAAVTSGSVTCPVFPKLPDKS